MTCKHWIKNTWWASHLLLALLYCWSQPSLSGAKEVDRLTTSSREESSGFQTGGQQGEEEEEMSRGDIFDQVDNMDIPKYVKAHDTLLTFPEKVSSRRF